MANVEKIHEVKLPDDVLRYSIHCIPQAIICMEETDNNQNELRSIKAGLIELLSFLTEFINE